MKPPTALLRKAAAKKLKARSGPRAGQQEPAPKRLKVRVSEPSIQESPPAPEIDLTFDTPPERGGAEEVVTEAPVSGEPAAVEPQAPSETPPARADRSWGEGPSGAVSPPSMQPANGPPRAKPERPEAVEANRPGPTPCGFSRMHDGRRAEGLIAQVIQPDFQEELRNLGSNRFFREAYSSFVRVINSFALTREALEGHIALCNQLQQDAEDAQARAEAAEKTLEEVRADSTRRLKEAEDKAETADNRQRAALNQLASTEGAVEARNLHIADLESALWVAEERAKKAEEEAQSSKEVERVMAASLAEERSAAEGRAAAAVEAFKASDLFTHELVEANSYSYIQGFMDARDKISRVLELPQAMDIGPDGESEGASDSEPAAEP